MQQPSTLLAGGSVRLIEPSDEQGIRSFVRLERGLNAGREAFVQGIEDDLRRRLAGRSAFNEGMEHAMFVALDEGDPVARCAAFVNHRYQAHHREAVGFIGCFDAAAGSQRQVTKMLACAEEWLAGKGVTRVIAPYNGSALLGLALRTGGHDETPMFPFNWHPPFYADYLDAAGYRPTYPWWSFRIDFSSDTYRHASGRALAHAACRVRPVDKKRWDAELETFLRLWNDGFADEWEMQPYTIEEFHELFDAFKPVIDPRQMLFAEVDGEPAAICLGMPEYNGALRRLKGRMGLVRQLRFALDARRVRDAGLIAIAVLPQFRGRHIGQTIAATLYRRYEELGLGGAEYHTVNDSNIASRSLAISLGGEGRILYHNFDKQLR